MVGRISTLTVNAQSKMYWKASCNSACALACCSLSQLEPSGSPNGTGKLPPSGKWHSGMEGGMLCVGEDGEGGIRPRKGGLIAGAIAISYLTFS